jgi:hypothetical protein
MRCGAARRTANIQDPKRLDRPTFETHAPMKNLVKLPAKFLCGLVAFWFQCLAVCGSSAAVERIVFRPSADSDAQISVVGEALVKAADGGMLLLADDGKLWTVQPERIISRESDATELQPISNKEAGLRLQRELPVGFEVYQTAHYVICHNTTDDYAKWVGSLFERAYTGFYSYWKNKGLDLPEPTLPMIAVVFADQKSFARIARPELGDLVDSVIGYYNLQTNRMMTFYLPNAERRVATLVHEAVHQLSYNSGLQKRMADNPYWVSEGLAIFFETTDSSARGWRNIGGINQVNLARFRNYLSNRPSGSLATLIRDDARFRNPASATDAYGEAWAFHFFLLRTRDKQYLAYLKQLSEGPLMQEADPRKRVQAFQDAMETDLETLDREFLLYMRRSLR